MEKEEKEKREKLLRYRNKTYLTLRKIRPNAFYFNFKKKKKKPSN